MLLEATNSLTMKVQVGHLCQFWPRDGILSKSSQPFAIWLFFWPLRLCIGHYSPPGGCDKLLEANNSLPMKVQVGHQCTVNTFGSKLGILTMKMKLFKYGFLPISPLL